MTGLPSLHALPVRPKLADAIPDLEQGSAKRPPLVALA
jgi:hypothetical protein